MVAVAVMDGVGEFVGVSVTVPVAVCVAVAVPVGVAVAVALTVAVGCTGAPSQPPRQLSTLSKFVVPHSPVVHNIAHTKLFATPSMQNPPPPGQFPHEKHIASAGPAVAARSVLTISTAAAVPVARPIILPLLDRLGIVPSPRECRLTFRSRRVARVMSGDVCLQVTAA